MNWVPVLGLRQEPSLFTGPAYKYFFNPAPWTWGVGLHAYFLNPISSKTRLLLIIIVSLSTPLLLAFAILGIFIHFWKAKKNRPLLVTVTKNGVLFSIWDFDGRIAYEDIVKATEDFDIKYCIGVGGYSSVYRAGLPSGKTVALKKLHRWDSNDPTWKAFVLRHKFYQSQSRGR